MNEVRTGPVCERLADFIHEFSIVDAPNDVVELAKSCLLYGLGVAACGLNSHPANMGSNAVVSFEPNIGPATVFNTGTKASMTGAVIANCALFHARAQEDTCGTAHLGAVLIPLLLAIAESRPVTFQRLLPAVAVGYEVGGQLEAEFAVDTLASGFRATPLFGLIAATAAACYLLSLDKATIANALSLAVAFDGSNIQTTADGSDELRFQPGLAAQSAWTSVQLAMAGATGTRAAYEGKFGFARVFARREFSMRVFERLGRDWILRKVMFKPFPICQHNQSAAVGAIKIRERLVNARPDRIEVHVNPYIVPGMLLKGPFKRPAETMLSTSFAVACALARGRVEIEDLEVFGDLEINRLNDLVTLVTTERLAYPASEIIGFRGSEEIARHAENVTDKDFNYSLDQSKAQLRRMFIARGLRSQSLDMFERLVSNTATAGVYEIASAFELART